MSFWGRIFNALGFEGEKKQEDITKNVKVGDAKYDLVDNNYYKNLPPVRLVLDQKQLQNTINELRDLKSIIFDFTNFDSNLKYRAIDFLAGSIFALEGDLKMLETDKFLCRLELEEE